MGIWLLLMRNGLFALLIPLSVYDNLTFLKAFLDNMNESCAKFLYDACLSSYKFCQIHLHAGTDAPLNVTFIRAPSNALLKVEVPLLFRGEDVSPGLRKGQSTLEFVFVNPNMLLYYN